MRGRGPSATFLPVSFVGRQRAAAMSSSPSSQRPPPTGPAPFTQQQHADRISQGTRLRRRDLGAPGVLRAAPPLSLTRRSSLYSPSNRGSSVAYASPSVQVRCPLPLLFMLDDRPLTQSQTIRAPLAAFVAAFGLGFYLYSTSRTLADERQFARGDGGQAGEPVAGSSREARKRTFAGRLW